MAPGQEMDRAYSLMPRDHIGQLILLTGSDAKDDQGSK